MLNTINSMYLNADMKLEPRRDAYRHWQKIDRHFRDGIRFAPTLFGSRWPELNLPRLWSGGRPTPSVHLLLFTSPCHAGRTRFLLFNYWKVFLPWVTGSRCQEELHRPETLPQLVCVGEGAAITRWFGGFFVGFFFASLDRTPVHEVRSSPPRPPPSCSPGNKSPVWYIYTARRNALGSRKWKAALVIILILRRLTQTSIHSRWWSSTVRTGHAGRFLLLNESCPIWKWMRAVLEMNPV